ncbi:MAG: UvrD-helicase domain-containing protein [Burkholderiaceae bacterium]|nr:UvrD-helicase domain-containing protein [Burkholderiaceae bacterium]MEB2318240.1 UvrD-helicase domain-containing protein [Pseudomonadota bacterium]
MRADLSLLNPAQREAVRYLDGPCLVIAGAGSGKTRVITHKIQHLIAAGMQPRAIGAITFTNKAAGEMAERLEPMLPKLPAEDRPLVCTFHSLGVRMLRADGQALGLKRNFSILDADDAAGIIVQLLGTTDRKIARQALARISLWKNGLVDPEEAAAGAADAAEHAVARAYRDYAETLAAYQAVDFDDLIRLPLRLLDEHEDVASKWRERLRYLLVDEYQDTNACQYELLKRLVGPRAAFTAVGDDDQSIYGWRGATLENLNRLSTEFPRLKVIKLEQNYRSSTTILAAANRLIEHNPKLHQKKLWSELGVGDPIQVVPCDDDEAEAESVVMRLQALKFERRASFGDFAILYRGNHQARVIEQALRKEHIPYVLSGGQSFFERAEIRDLIAYLRLLANEDDDPALIRAITTPRRGIGSATLTALGSYAGERRISMFEALFETGFESRIGARQLADLRDFGGFINRLQERAPREPAGELIDQLLEAIGYREFLFDSNDEKVAVTRWQNVCDFTDWMKKRAENDGADLIALAQTIALLTQLDGRREETDAVRMSTIHAAKGLEYPHVFLVGCEEGVMPHHGGLSADEVAAEAEAASAGDGPSDEVRARRIEEERRLMYVAVTRAKRSLTLTWCRARKRGRDKLLQLPSRFIAEMQLEARPASKATVSAATARGRLGALKALLANRD